MLLLRKAPTWFLSKFSKVSINKYSVKWFFSSEKKVQKQSFRHEDENKQLTYEEEEPQKSELMKKEYEQIQIDSFEGKTFSSLNELQRSIVKENKFDLSNPQIKPKMSKIRMSGLAKSGEIAEIQLGSIKVKNKNQVFLSQIDPYNIPQDYQVRFDQQKQLTLVGKKIKKNKNTQQTDNQIESHPNQMKISTVQSFEQKTASQLSEKYMGQIGYKYQFNRKTTFRQFLLVLPFIIFVFYPIISTINEVYQCLKSIQQIQEEQMKEIKKIKKSRMIYALLHNSDFNQQI